ncbi:hypothetical protein LguiA_036682 [Lonicera macranthoides]
MEEYSGKRTAGGLVVPRKGSSLVLREKVDNKDQSAQFCNRLGCSGRLHYTKGTQMGNSEKPKSVRTSFRSTGKEMIGSSSKTFSGVSNSKKSLQVSQKKVSNKLETDSSDGSSSSVQDKLEVSESVTSQLQLRDTAESSKIPLTEVGSSSVASNSRSRKIFCKKSVLGDNQDAQLGSSVPSASKSSAQGARDGASANRYGLRNLRCNSMSDVIPQGSSSSLESNTRGKDLAKKRNPERESSSSVKGKKLSGPSYSGEGRTSLSASSISISDSRRTRNWPPSREIGAASSVRTRRSMNFSSKMGHPNNGNGINPSSRQSPVGFQRVHQSELQIDGNISSSSHQFSAESSSSRSSSYIHPSSESDRLQNLIPLSSAELGISRLTNRGSSQHYNMEGIAEVLLALERIEQDEELTYEQLLALESNLFLGGLNFYDQHRDMRLDIDNMSYEELLALEEKMGNVSTALSEEALINCLKRSIYQPLSPEEGTMEITGDGDLTKCSICQEEYVDGDEIGRLGCEHGYHALCIQHWLRLKNWCPICKGSVAPPSLSAS